MMGGSLKRSLGMAARRGSIPKGFAFEAATCCAERNCRSVGFGICHARDETDDTNSSRYPFSIPRLRSGQASDGSTSFTTSLRWFDFAHHKFTI
jgi:hypothetical protein